MMMKVSYCLSGHLLKDFYKVSRDLDEKNFLRRRRAKTNPKFQIAFKLRETWQKSSNWSPDKQYKNFSSFLCMFAMVLFFVFNFLFFRKRLLRALYQKQVKNVVRLICVAKQTARAV